MKGDKRPWCFTINNWTEDDWDRLISVAEDARYLVFSMEHCGDRPPEVDTWTPHIQGYVYFANPRSFESLQKKLPRARIVPAKGTPEANYMYISKESMAFEIGDRPAQGVAGKEAIDSLMEDPYENFHLWNQYSKNYKELKATETFKKERKRPQVLIVDFLWQVIDTLPDEVYIWNMGQCDLFDGYQGEDTICINMPMICVSGPQLLILEQWIIYNRPPRYRCGYVWSACTATKLVIACEDRYKNLKDIKSFLSIEKDGEADIQEES